MTNTITAGKKRAVSALKQAGHEFVEGFMSVCRDAISLRSKEPGVCWKAAGQVSFAAISEFAGPNTMEDGAPLVFRLRTNLYPPPALFYHMKSQSVRQKLLLNNEPSFAKEPALELTALPSEAGKFGRWLTEWLDGQFYRHSACPMPPTELISWSVNDDMSARKEDVTKVGPDWRMHLYLWTPNAMKEFETWLMR